MSLICPYCNLDAPMVGGDEIYPHRPDLYHKHFYRCPQCKAFVGCHPGTAKPLGRLADEKLRKAKMAAHASFDRLWKNGGKMSRREAYAWLASALGIPSKQCHIGMFDLDGCERVLEVVRNRRMA